jgi:ATP-dependent phosphofructokinase / diphosphate-dependent phosphofructokinase
MDQPTKRIGIVNAGGDCAGINAVISAVVKSGIPLGYEFIGFERGWEGLLSPLMYRKLDLHAVRNISFLGGTILRTTNRGRFGAKVGEGEVGKIPEEILEEAKGHLKELGIEGLILIGGDGTMSGGLQLAEHGVNIVGVPKTIDNDLGMTDQTFGFSTAVSIAVEAIDKVQTTAYSHDRLIFVECMGRYAGWISLFAGLAGGADAILLPEFPFSAEKFVNFLHSRRKNHKYYAVVVVAEGLKIGDKLIQQAYGNSSEVKLGGVSVQLMHVLEEMTPGDFEMRNVVLGHVQRGGSPNAEDRILAKSYGVAAMEAYARGDFNSIVCLRKGEMTTVSIAQAVDKLKLVTADTKEYQVAKKLGVFID